MDFFLVLVGGGGRGERLFGLLNSNFPEEVNIQS